MITRVVMTREPDGTWRVAPYDDACERVVVDDLASLWEAGMVAAALEAAPPVHTTARAASKRRPTPRGR